MKIGFISAWNERGASYVTKAYIDALKDNNEIFLYERGSDSDNFLPEDPKINITHGLKLFGTDIDPNHFIKWTEKNKIEILFFNEQHDFEIIAYIKKERPDVIIGTYIDYYKLSWVKYFGLYDFLICNTKRHFSVFNKHLQCFYVPWGVNTDLYNVNQKTYDGDKTVFFHSAGMSLRKGTDLLIKTFVENLLGEKSKLIIHTQINVSNFTDLSIEQLREHNIEVIEKTVTAPGLYYLGDVYVYPTLLDGLGLTMYEALSSGMPVITTDCAPMNEIVTEENGRLIDVDKYICRDDGYYWPLSVPDNNSLLQCMQHYIDNPVTKEYSDSIRESCIDSFSWKDRISEINKIFESVESRSMDSKSLNDIIQSLSRKKATEVKEAMRKILPNSVIHFIKKRER